MCLSSYIREFKNVASKEKLKCPNEGCKALISVHDIKSVLNEEEFMKLCDIRVHKHVEGDESFHHCFSPNCERIFQV